ncbi:MAG: zinc-ribbon domain-containing protein [Ruminococcus sp.]|nr:zinc-ribbon domain-containing protein [Ruminococcus sp.]
MYGQNQFYTPDPFIHRNREYVRQFLCKPILLILGILQAVSAVLTIIQSVVTSSMSQSLNQEINRFIVDLTGENVSVADSGSVSIPLMPIALAIAFFTIYFCAKKSNGNFKAGVTTFWVISIVALVVCIIAAVILGLSIILLLVLLPRMRQELLLPAMYYNNSILPNAYNNEVATGITLAFILVVAIMAIALTFILLYGINQFRFASSIRKSISTPYLFANGAKAYGVLHVISSVFSCLGTIGSVIGFFAVMLSSENLSRTLNINMDSDTSIAIMGLSLLSSILTFAYNIYMAKFALGYNKHILAATQGGYEQAAPAVNYSAPSAQPYYQPPVQTAQQPFAPVQESAPIYSESGATTILNPEQTASAPTPEYPMSGATTVLTPEPEAVPIPSEDSEPEADKEAVPGFCPECGTPVIPGQAFCSECGTKTI